MENNTDIRNEYSDEEKLKAAYALNMCTVSVSQIVDYNDLYILEQEYDAILNNLNLKVIPKDEALLRILTELLNTITFFRIQDMKKNQIEKEYQQRMKSAIWSAVPSLSVFVSGNPVTMALSLATTVGTGYMNYRREKVQAGSEKEKAEMELQITAIEQFNALRRELFTTAWRLAAEYDFEDKWRLTEKQIKQYNEIIIDQDELRKYARLEAIQDKFMAYPPFWYYMGHTANYISQVFQDEETKVEFREKAKRHFDVYEKLNAFNILREDQMTASYALEYIDLLFLDEKRDNKKISKLIKTAIEKAGNNNDILQLCATSCLRIGQYEEAAGLLKVLVNEDYNKVINAQLLSALYVSKRNRPEYSILETRVSPRYLYPMPVEGQENIDVLNQEFEAQQKLVLKEKFKGTLQNIINKYSEQFNREISQFDLEEEYGDSFFENSKKAKRERLAKAKMILSDEEKRRFYSERMKGISLPLEYTNILQKMFDNIFSVNCYLDPVLQDDTVEKTTNAISKNKDHINSLQEKIDEGIFAAREYEQLQKIGVVLLVREAFEELYQDAVKQIDATDVDDLMRLEGNLMQLCNKMNLPEPEIAIGNEAIDLLDFDRPKELFDVSMFGTKAIVAKKTSDYLKAMASYVKNKIEALSLSNEAVKTCYREEVEFNRYFNNSIFESYSSLKANSLAIIFDCTKSRFDLIFTTEGLVYVIKGKVCKKAPYENITYTKNALDLWGRKYKNENVDLAALYELIHGLDKKFINNIDQKIEYIDGIVSAKILNAWFKNNSDSMIDSVSRVYSWADQGMLEQMGYYIEKELDRNNYLLQFYCDLESGYILGLRIVEFDVLDPDFAEKLTKAGGVLRVER